MKKNSLLILRMVLIALVLFLLKHFIQAIIEFTDIIPVRPKAYIWGMFHRAQYVFMWQLVFTFWVYILSVILFYFMLKIRLIKKIKSWKIVSSISFILFLFLLYVYRVEFPIKKTYFPSGTKFNFELLEEWIIYSLVGFALIFLIRRKLLDNKK